MPLALATAASDANGSSCSDFFLFCLKAFQGSFNFDARKIIKNQLYGKYANCNAFYGYLFLLFLLLRNPLRFLCPLVAIVCGNFVEYFAISLAISPVK